MLYNDRKFDIRKDISSENVLITEVFNARRLEARLA